MLIHDKEGLGLSNVTGAQIFIIRINLSTGNVLTVLNM
jgi:hypothetical protein